MSYDLVSNARTLDEMIAKHFKSKLPVVGNIFTGCSTNRSYLVRLYLPFTEPIIAYHSCIVNEAVALCNRHLVQHRNIDCYKDVVIECFKIMRLKHPIVPLTAITPEEVLRTKRANKRKTYLQAYKRYMMRGLVRRDYEISMFVKYERMSIKCPLKPPRAIQARGPAFNLVLQQYVIPYAKHLTRNLELGERFSTKGLDQYELAAFLHKGWVSFKRPVAFLLDHDRFDSRTNRYWLAGMHDYLSDHFDDPEVTLYTSCLIKSKAITLHGLRYVVSDSVCSGDTTTSDGNTTINEALLCHHFNGVHHIDYINGDDSVVMIEHDDLDEMLSRSMERYGYGTKISYVHEFEQIEYCQCQPVLTVNGWLMVRNPERILSRSTVCLTPKSLEYLRAWFASVGECELSCNQGVPVLQHFAKFLLKFSDKRVDVGDIEFHRITKQLDCDITLTTRESFQRAFGISISEQYRLEWFFQFIDVSWFVNFVDEPTIPTLTIPK